MDRNIGRHIGVGATTGTLVLLALGCWREPQTRESHRVPTRARESKVSPELPHETETATLIPSSSRESELAAGAARTYRLALEADEYLHLCVDQIGVDVAVTVSGPPEGRRLLRVDSPNGKGGVEHVFLVAESAGEHRVEIRASDADPGNRYRARIEALRPATIEDRQRAAAARAFSVARILEKEDRSAVVRAAERYRDAARLWRELGDEPRQATALYNLGKLCARSTDRLHEAIEVFSQAVILYRRLGDERQEAHALHRLGKAWSNLGNPDSARRYHEESLALWHTLGDLFEQATLFNDLANLDSQQGKIHAALELYGWANERWRRLGERCREATTRTNLGYLYMTVGETRKALDHYRRALAQLEGCRNPGQMAITLNKLGDALLQLEGPEAALERFREALELRREVRDPRGEAVTINSIGLAQVRAAQPREALEAFRTSLEIFRKLGIPAYEATVLNNLGSAYKRLDQLSRAMECYREAFELAHAASYRHAEAEALFGIARVERRRDRWELAQRSMEQALDVIETIRLRHVRYDLRASYLATKQDYYEFLVELLAELHRRDPFAGYHARAFEISERARARSLLDAIAEGRPELDRQVDPGELRRLEALREEINSRHIDLLGLSWQNGAAEVEQQEAELAMLLEQFRHAEAEIRRHSSRYVDLTQPKVLSLRQVREEVLDDDTLLLEYYLGEWRSYLWAVTSTGSSFHELPAREEVEEAAMGAYSGMIRSHHQTDEVAARLAARKLSRLLLAPVADLLGGRRLVIVAPGALQYVPFAALPDPAAVSEKPLIVDHEILSLPSASVLKVLREQTEGRQAQPGLIALLADPVFELDDERLPDVASHAGATSPEESSPESPSPEVPYLERLDHSRREADAILDLAAGSPTLPAFGFDARRKLVESGRLGGYRIVHFATHGILDTEHPELSAIVLSRFDREGRPVDGYLRAYEVFNLNLPAELVVLSACRTALGKSIRGEGLVGMTRGFIYAGAARVLVSLWNVSDRATAELMERFYRGLLRDQLPPAQALREAQLSMWREQKWRAPYYWAAFVLQGDWR